MAAAGDLCAVTAVTVLASMSLPFRVLSMFGIVAGLYHAMSLAVVGCTPAVWVIGTYAAAQPQLRRRHLFAFRRLVSARKGDPTVRREAASWVQVRPPR